MDEPPATDRSAPAAEVDVTVELVRSLIEDQHPDLAGRPLRPVAAGWDNAMWRLGDGLAVRLPRRRLGAALMDNELRWLPMLSEHVPVPIPAPVRVGEPGNGYPWRWSVVPWFAGTMAAIDPLQTTEAPRLGAALAALHGAPTPPDPPFNLYRGVPLATLADRLWLRLDALETDRPTLAALHAVAERALAAEPATRLTWIHGDLHPKNVIGDAGRLIAIVDWGDLTVGDPATDLAATWMLFDAAALDDVRRGHGDPDPALWARAAGWALHFGLMLGEAASDRDEHFAAVSRRTLAGLVAQV